MSSCPSCRRESPSGEPCLVALGASTTGLVRAAVGNTTGLTFLDDRYDRPASVIRSNRDLFTAHLTDGASQIRVASEVPHPGLGAPWDGWARYEAAVNQAYAEFPLWGLCAYDTRITPDPVLDDVARTHPHLATADGRRGNPRYQDPAEFLTQRPPSQADPVETASPPVIDLIDPTPAAARDAVHTASMIRPDTVRPDPTAPEAIPRRRTATRHTAARPHRHRAPRFRGQRGGHQRAHPRPPPGPVPPVDRAGPHRRHGHRPR